MATLQLEIVTPDRKAYSDQVDYVVLPAIEREMGIYPNHVPFLTTIHPGELQVKKGNHTQFLVTGEGFVEITGSQVIVLTDMAIKEEEIDEKKVEEALARAKKALEEKHSAEESAALAAMIQKSVAQLNLKRKRRH
jgi:F-type H+-transporting ATPase subunit epsilon